jgi:hypothetical protein
MSKFKDAVKKDIETTFINPEEFGDKHILNDKEVICVVDTNELNEAKATVSNPIDGVFVNSVTIYVKTVDLERKPVVGEPLYLDDDMYLVEKVSDEMGLLVILAGVHEQ